MRIQVLLSARDVAALRDGATVVDAWARVWRLEEWESTAAGWARQERCWFTTGDRVAYTDEDVVEALPVRLLKRLSA